MRSPRREIPFPTKGKVSERFARRGDSVPLYREYPPPAPTGGEGRGGRERFSRGIVRFCGNAFESKGGDVETDGL